MILNHDTPDDFVVATGVTHSIREMCEYVFKKLDMNHEDYIVINDRFLRPNELNYLKGDSSISNKELDWKPEYSFNELMDDMIESWLKYYEEK